ncbi:uncharacterized protein HD556DRAFT_1441101 [Suillus plorans]|uniref:Uncharacterized protein n=1 Tax=Suillus plorans TaxID=116603 RepID=A0A9P7DK99_9AGAM|nr:uncharacterized protein HD556DRAFT_1441101 [Suillus plorans]KAG1796926.1 hypothetical protein HD556DRAFT_1441101 [Suillus plorans]
MEPRVPQDNFEGGHLDDTERDANESATDRPPSSYSASSNLNGQSQARNHMAPPPITTRLYHPDINGRICDEQGNYIPLDTPPPCSTDRGPDDWMPYNNWVEFEVADFLYHCNQMSGGDIDFVFNLWAASLAAHGATPPFKNHVDMYNTIDSTPLGGVLWQSFSSQYNGALPNGDVPSWMTCEYDVWFRDPRLLVHNIISNPDFKDEFDYALLQEYSTNDGAHRFQDFMSGDWCWKQADLIAEDPDTIGSMFMPIILGSDKTTVSVATGHNQYWPVYMSIGNICNNVRCAHRNGVVLLGFLAIPKTDHESTKDAHFPKFCRQLLHSSLAKMLETLQPGMTKPEVVRCPDGHFRRAVYGLGPYIADYPEQALLACIVQNWCPKCTAPADNLNEGMYGRRSHEHTDVLVEEFELGVLWDEYGLVGDIVPFTNYFPWADIHELLSPDILHQLIKGAFKDHIVTWVHDYIEAQYSRSEANKILDDIDHRISLAPAFTALMKVYIPAIEGHVPSEMVQALQVLLDFIYIARRNIIDTNSLKAMDNAVERFHKYWLDAHNTNDVEDTKSVVNPQFEHRRSNINADSEANADEDGDAVDGPTVLLGHVDLAKTVVKQIYSDDVADQIGQPNFTLLIHRFLRNQCRGSYLVSNSSSSDSTLPEVYEKITLYSSAVATFFAPSDISGIGGMHYKRIRAVDTWGNGPGRHDCIFISTDPSAEGMRGFDIAQVRLFFSFKHNGILYPCALVHWFKRVRNLPDEITGMWVVEPEVLEDGTCLASVVHLNAILRAAHLIPVYGNDFVPTYLSYTQTLDAFRTYYVNKYIDHQAYEIAF